MATAPQYVVVAALLSEPAVIAATIAGAAGIALRWVPKTRSEAGVDRSLRRFNEAQSWALLVKTTQDANGVLQADIQTLRARVDAAENALLAERAECDRQIQGLISRIEELERERGANQRVFFRE